MDNNNLSEKWENTEVIEAIEANEEWDLEIAIENKCQSISSKIVWKSFEIFSFSKNI